jgi:4-diphosphocytidyl-2-C-methyl-D-erythritol kinase
MTATLPLRASWRSPAKVNLCLRVVGRRADGYHLLDSVFAPIDLCDTITVDVDAIARGAATRIDVGCDRADVPQDASNLAARAASALLAECGLGGRMRITIVKTIPPGSGLGGGSGNAATVLRELNARLGLGVTHARVRELAVALGADVPFFLDATPARVRGIGEDVQPIVGFHDVALVVAIPPVTVSTAWAFRAYAELVPSPAAAGDEPARLAAGAAPSAALLINDLERVVLPAFPAIAALKRLLYACGAEAAVMSGSGSAVIGLAAPSTAAPLAAAVRRAAPEVAIHAVVAGRIAPGARLSAVDPPAGAA